MPIAPAGEGEPVVARARRRSRPPPRGRRSGPRRRRSRPRGAARRARRRSVAPVIGPVGRSGRARGLRAAGSVSPAPTASASRSSASTESSGPAGEHVHLAAVGHERARLVRVGEERHRRLGVDEHEVAGARRAGRPRTRRGSRAGRAAGRPAPRSSRAGNVSPSTLAPGRRGDPARGAQPRPRAPPRRRAGTRPARRSAAPWPRPRPRRRSTAVAGRDRHGRDRARAFEPRHVGREDERRDLARAGAGPRATASARVAGHVLGSLATCGSSPRRCSASVSMSESSGRVVLVVVRGVVADDVDDRACAPAGVVQVGDAVAEAGAEVQQRRARAGRPCGRSRRRRR